MGGSGIKQPLLSAFRWLTDREKDSAVADDTRWWREAELLRDLGPALAELCADERPTVVLGAQSRGFLLGPLVAVALGVGFVEVRKEPQQVGDVDRWVRRTTTPDYLDRHVVLGIRAGLVSSSDRVVFVDDWIDTGAQASAVAGIVGEVGASWAGVAVIVDALVDGRVRRELGVRALLNHREL